MTDIVRHKAEVTFENHIHLCNTSDPKVFGEFLRSVADRVDLYIPDPEPEPCELCTPEHIREMMNHLGHARALAAYGRHVANAHPEKYPPTELPGWTPGNPARMPEWVKDSVIPSGGAVTGPITYDTPPKRA